MKKLVKITAGQTGTHVEADANILDVLNPMVPMADTTGALVRTAAHAAVVAAGTSKFVSGRWIPAAAESNG